MPLAGQPKKEFQFIPPERDHAPMARMALAGLNLLLLILAMGALRTNYQNVSIVKPTVAFDDLLDQTSGRVAAHSSVSNVA